MTRFVLRRNEDGKYVAPNPHPTATVGMSYVTDKRDAKKFTTREAARSEACGNETVEPIDCDC